MKTTLSACNDCCALAPAGCTFYVYLVDGRCVLKVGKRQFVWLVPDLRHSHRACSTGHLSLAGQGEPARGRAGRGGHYRPVMGYSASSFFRSCV